MIDIIYYVEFIIIVIVTVILYYAESGYSIFYYCGRFFFSIRAVTRKIFRAIMTHLINININNRCEKNKNECPTPIIVDSYTYVSKTRTIQYYNVYLQLYCTRTHNVAVY